MTGKRTVTTVVAGDVHVPFEDPKAISCFLAVLRCIKPTRVVLQGDIFDCLQISKFQCDPARITSLQSDVERGTALIARVRAAAPRAHIVMQEGNHENRLGRLVCEQPRLSSLAALSPEEFFGLNKIPNIEWVPYRQRYRIGKMILVHGHLARKAAGHTAKAMMDVYTCDGISGHTHRFGCCTRRIGEQTFTWRENGCLCSLTPEYMHEGTADWAHGFAIIRDVPGISWPVVEHVEIRGGRCYSGSMLLTA